MKLLLTLSTFLLIFLNACYAQNCSRDDECSDPHDVVYGGVCDQLTGECTCNDTLPTLCFEISNNTCMSTVCSMYYNVTNDCRVGTKSKTTTILLSIFLINFGAANFYIERYALAVPQIILGLLLCVFQFGSCAAACTRGDKDKTSIPCILCCSINSVLSLSLFSWWIADLIIFATGSQTSGDGCPLY